MRDYIALDVDLVPLVEHEVLGVGDHARERVKWVLFWASGLAVNAVNTSGSYADVRGRCVSQVSSECVARRKFARTDRRIRFPSLAFKAG